MEIGRQRLFDQIGVQLGHAVDGVAAGHRQVRHAHLTPVALFEKRDAMLHRRIAGEASLHFGDDAAIDLLNDLHMPRQHALEHFHRPALQRFRQQGVIREGARLECDRPSLLPRKRLLVQECAHQLCHRERRMRVVQMDGDF